MAKVYSVSQINSYIKNMFTQDFVLNDISISGEVSNRSYNRSGHVYFSLKDASAAISCVLFAGAKKRGLDFELENGQQVIVDGSISVYEQRGVYELYASKIRLAGEGALYEKFLALKQELEEMGMFDASYKKAIPSYVRTLGVVTAPTGAVLHDIITVSRRRSPGIRIVLCPAKVQGEGAADSVAAGLRALDTQGLDVIIVGRGGGSIEDLWAFNEETVARAIFDCTTPVISAVGHETDTTIADYVADLRAPTPSAAAELAVPDMAAVLEQLRAVRAQMNRLMNDRVLIYRMRLDKLKTRLSFASPAQRVREQRRRLTDLQDAFEREIGSRLQDRKQSLALYAQRLKSVSPLEKLAQGYACVTDADHKRVYSVEQVKPQDAVTIYVSDGQIDASVTAAAHLAGEGGSDG